MEVQKVEQIYSNILGMKVQPKNGSSILEMKVGIIYSLNGNAQLHNAQIAGQMTAGSGNIVDQKFTNLLAELRSFLIIQLKQIIVTIDSI